MLTINANAHPLMNRMHKPAVDLKTKVPLPPEKQDKRSLVVIERSDVERWLQGTVDDAKSLLELTPVAWFRAGPHAIDEQAVTP